MTQQIIRAPLFEAPPTTPIKGSLLDVATIHDGMAWLGSQQAFSTYNCLTMSAIGDFCSVGDNTYTTSPKNLGAAPNWMTPDAPFGVYGGITCKSVGYSGGMDGLTKAFNAMEGVGVEKALQAFMGGANVTPVVLDPKGGGTTVSPKAGVAALEDHAASHYAGVPTLHMPRGIAAVLTNTMIEYQGSAMHTFLGSKVAAGGGYTGTDAPGSTAAPAAGDRWLYATGEVVLWRGDLTAHEELNRDNNDMVALVERTYMLAIDCYIAAVKVSVE